MPDDFMKAIVVRLPIPLAEDLEMVADVECMPQAVVVRKAISDYLAARRADPEYQRTDARLRQLRARSATTGTDPSGTSR